MSSDLRLAWCSYEAARFACLSWHYTRSMPTGKTVKVGAWENDQFIGCVIISRGNTPYIGAPFGLRQDEIAELTRVALAHHEAPTSRILSIAVRMLHRQSPGLRLLVSYADPKQGHVGVLYQALNWTFIGLTNAESLIRLRGRLRHPRSVGGTYGTRDIQWLRTHVDPHVQRVIQPPKLKYAWALDHDMRQLLAPLAKPYPKRPKEQAPARPAGLDGASPIRPLHLIEHYDA